MKRIFLFILLLKSVFCFSQTQTDSIKVKTSFTLAGKRVTKISNDTSSSNNDSLELITKFAAKKLRSGGSSFDPASNQTITGNWSFTNGFQAGNTESPGAGIFISNAEFKTIIGDFTGDGNGTKINVDDDNQVIELFSPNLYFSGSMSNPNMAIYQDGHIDIAEAIDLYPNGHINIGGGAIDLYADGHISTDNGYIFTSGDGAITFPNASIDESGKINAQEIGLQNASIYREGTANFVSDLIQLKLGGIVDAYGGSAHSEDLEDWNGETVTDAYTFNKWGYTSQVNSLDGFYLNSSISNSGLHWSINKVDAFNYGANLYNGSFSLESNNGLAASYNTYGDYATSKNMALASNGVNGSQSSTSNNWDGTSSGSSSWGVAEGGTYGTASSYWSNGDGEGSVMSNWGVGNDMAYGNNINYASGIHNYWSIGFDRLQINDGYKDLFHVDENGDILHKLKGRYQDPDTENLITYEIGDDGYKLFRNSWGTWPYSIMHIAPEYINLYNNTDGTNYKEAISAYNTMSGYNSEVNTLYYIGADYDRERVGIKLRIAGEDLFDVDDEGNSTIRGSVTACHGNVIMDVFGEITAPVYWISGTSYGIGSDGGASLDRAILNNILLNSKTTSQINSMFPSEGRIAYNSTLHTICFYNGTNWQKVSSTNMN